MRISTAIALLAVLSATGMSGGFAVAAAAAADVLDNAKPTPKPPPYVEGLPRPTEDFPNFGMWATGNQRLGANKDRDIAQQPTFMLLVFGDLRPRNTFIEVLPEDSYWEELIGGALTNGGARGHYIQTADSSDKAVWDRMTALKAVMELHWGIHVDLKPLSFDGVTPESADMVMLSKKMGKLMRLGKLDAVLAASYKSLKAGGELVVEDYRADARQPQDPKAASGYINEDYAIAQIQKAGFKLAGRDDKLFANAKDTRAQASDASDRFLLKFEK